jgi:hypothetical protein
VRCEAHGGERAPADRGAPRERGRSCQKLRRVRPKLVVMDDAHVLTHSDVWGLDSLMAATGLHDPGPAAILCCRCTVPAGRADAELRACDLAMTPAESRGARDPGVTL